MRKIRTLSIGGATFDLFLDTASPVMHECGDLKAFALPLGGKLRIEHVTGTFGGGAANTSVGLARLGCSAGFCGPLGNDQWGGSILANLKRENVDCSNATVVEDEASSFSVILSAESGERTILTHKGIDRHLGDPTFDREAASSMDAVYVTHIHPESCEITDDLANMLTSLPQIHLTWNPGSSQIDLGMNEKNTRLLLPHVDLLLLNKEEVIAFTGKITAEDAMRALIDAGTERICVTDGPNGVMATDGKRLCRCEAMPTKVRDTTGAGDAFGTAATWAILTGKDLPDALKAGTINATSVVGAVGAQAGLLTETEIKAKLEHTECHVTVEPF